MLSNFGTTPPPHNLPLYLLNINLQHTLEPWCSCEHAVFGANKALVLLHNTEVKPMGDMYSSWQGDRWLHIGCQWRDRNLSDSIKKILICVLKMDKCLTGLKQHESE